MKKDNTRSIVCFGETLWDVFGTDKQPGGAPLNVAIHLRQFGYHPKMISSVGEDELGDELREIVREKGLNTDFLQVNTEYSTGVVNVSVADTGDATYDIVFPSAWDFIEIPQNLKEKDFILIFGSLASRNHTSRETLFSLLEKAQIALFDVNFRAPHYTRELIEDLLGKSDIIKLNEDEIRIIGSWLGHDDKPLTDICKALDSIYELIQIIVTLGSEGAMVYANDQIYRHNGFKVNVTDTVGSGDSFLASYLAQYLKGLSIPECLEMACATGAYVATQNGAVPKYQMSDLYHIINANI